MDKTIVVPVLTIEITIPIEDCRRAAGVLAVAVAQFGPGDPVRLVLAPEDDTNPTAEHAQALHALCTELEATLGALPQISLVPRARLNPHAALASVSATGDAAADARSILTLVAHGRRLGSSLGATPGSLYAPRGGFSLCGQEMRAARHQRELYRPRTADAPVRIAILLWGPDFWTVVEGVADAARARPDVELEVVALVDERTAFRGGSPGSAADFFAERAIVARDFAWLRGHVDDFDIIVTPDPYDHQRTEGLRSRDLALAGLRLVYLPYAQALSAESANLKHQYNLPLANLAWRIYVASQSQLDNFSRHCDAGSSHVRWLGSIKNERLLTSESGLDSARRLREQLATDTVTLWNPHWTINPGGWSTFVGNVGPIMQFFAGRPDRGLIVRPHPGLFAQLEAAGGPDQVRQFRLLCADLPNVHLDESSDHIPAMLAADALVSDLSSVIPEYLCLNRPVGYLRRAGAELNGDRSWCDRVSTLEEAGQVSAFLDQPPTLAVSPQPCADLGSAARVVDAIVTDFRAETAATEAEHAA